MNEFITFIIGLLIGVVFSMLLFGFHDVYVQNEYIISSIITTNNKCQYFLKDSRFHITDTCGKYNIGDKLVIERGK